MDDNKTTDISEILGNSVPESKKKDDFSAYIDDTWTSKGKPSRKKDEEEYARRFLSVHKIKEYTPVYIDVKMKEKLQTLVSSLQHIVSEITPTILLSNILADHLSVNRELMCRISIDGKTSTLVTGICCKPNDWNAKKGIIKTERDNNRLTQFKERLVRLILTILLNIWKTSFLPTWQYRKKM